MFDLIKSERKDGYGGKDGGDREEYGKGGLDRNSPDLVIFKFIFLGSFKSIKLPEREEVTVIVGAVVDENSFGDHVVFDAGHGSFADRTGDRRSRGR